VLKRRPLEGICGLFVIFGRNIRFILRLLSSLVGIDANCINFFGASVVIFVLCCDKRADGDRLDGLKRRFFSANGDVSRLPSLVEIQSYIWGFVAQKRQLPGVVKWFQAGIFD